MEETTRGRRQDVLEKQCGWTMSGLNWQRRGTGGAKSNQAKPSQSVNWWGGDLSETQVDVPLYVSHSSV